MKKIPIVIDTDPGVDDAFAIMMAASRPEFDIRAITVVAGNVGIEHTARNARDLAGLLGLSTRIAKGAEKPMIVPQELAAEIHGANGLADVTLPAQTQISYDEKPAWDAIYEEAVKAKGELKLIAIGPLTNIALAILKYPDLVELVPQIVIMGGALSRGNHSPYGEFNVWVDPHASEIVFESGMEVAMIDLDACMMLGMPVEKIDEFQAMDTTMSFLINPLLERSRGFIEKFGRDTFGLGADPAAMAYLINPKVYKTKKVYCTCEVSGKHTFGRTVVSHWGNKEPNTLIMLEGNNEIYTEICTDMMKEFERRKREEVGTK